MPRLPRWSLVPVLVAAVLGPARLLGGDGLRTDVAALLEIGAENDPTSVDDARQLYDQLKRAAPADRRIDYAYGIVLMRRGRPRESLPLLASYAKANRNDPRASLIEAFVLLESQRHGDALAAAVALAARLPDPGNALDRDQADDLARSLGRLIALHGIRTVPAESDARVEATNQILARLGDARLALFDEGRREVLDQFEGLRSQRLALHDDQSKVKSDRHQKLADATEQGRRQVAEKQNAIDASGESLAGTQRELSVLLHQLSQILQDRQRMAVQITALDAQLAVTAAPLNPKRKADAPATTIESAGPVPAPIPITGPYISGTFKIGSGPVKRATDDVVDPNQTTETADQSTALSKFDRFLVAQTQAMTVMAIRRQAFELDRRIMALRARAGMLMDESKQHKEALDTSEAALRGARRSVGSLETQLRRAKSPQSQPAPRTVTAQMQRISTYLPTLYDDESQRVLSWFDE